MERSEERNIMLEYFDKGHQFHYNTGNHPIPDEHGCYMPLGWCSMNEASLFCAIVNPLIVKKRYDTPDIPFDTMKEAWDDYCEMIMKGRIKI